MKKSNLITGIVYLLAGIVFLGTALLTDTKLDGLFSVLQAPVSSPES